MTIPVRLEKDGYSVTLEKGALKRAGEIFDLERKVFIVTDSGVPREYALCVAHGAGEYYLETIPAGEGSKNMDTYAHILSDMLSFGMKRGDCVVSVGGGVAGDIAGFAAATYMRGVDFYNVPTTLLAMVDASVGGKTAIDLNGVKNAVGAFYQPKAVLADPEVLSTLDKRQLGAGMAELIKMAVTFDEGLFSRLENEQPEPDGLSELIERAIEIKAEVVEKDEREAGLRRALNFGHTIGHAIESAAGGALLHGECVAMGMLPMCSDKAAARLRAVLEKYSLKTHIPFDAATLEPYIRHDKKACTGGINAVTVENAGSFEMKKMTVEEILSRLGETK